MPRKERGVSLVGIIFVFIAFLVMAISIQNLNSTNIAFIKNLTDEWDQSLEDKYKTGVDIHKKDFSDWFKNIGTI